MTDVINQQASFDASPTAVWQALMTSEGHAGFSGEPARISDQAGGSFTAYGDYISGVNIDLIPGKLIVQAWRASNWKAGHWSLVTFRFAKAGKGCKLSFTHIGVPADEIASIASGWHDFYWKPMTLWLART